MAGEVKLMIMVIPAIMISALHSAPLKNFENVSFINPPM
jgi:hypothetical protein